MRGLYRVKNLTKIYEKKEVFKNLDLEIKNDEITVILGKSVPPHPHILLLKEGGASDGT